LSSHVIPRMSTNLSSTFLDSFVSCFELSV